MKILDEKTLNMAKTEYLIINAFLMLLKRYSFEEVTVTQICQNANLARVTFYRKFASKEDVLRLYMRGLVDEYFSKIRSTEVLTLESLARSYFTSWKEKSGLIELLSSNKISNILLDEFTRIEPYLEELNIKYTILSKFELTDTEKYYFHAHNVAGLWRLIFLWANRGYRESVDEMTSIYLKTIAIVS